MKVNLQTVYTIPTGIKWIAQNENGTLNGFYHPPIRDYLQGVWQDSVDGSYGEFIVFDVWDRSVREVAVLTDCSLINTHELSRKKRLRKLEESLKKEDKNMETCPKCKGEKGIWNDAQTCFMECPQCNGSGYV